MVRTIGLFSLQHTKMCDRGDCLGGRSSLALALQAYRTLPNVPAGQGPAGPKVPASLVSHREGKL